jgi:hypothetical protein
MTLTKLLKITSAIFLITYTPLIAEAQIIKSSTTYEKIDNNK